MFYPMAVAFPPHCGGRLFEAGRFGGL